LISLSIYLSLSRSDVVGVIAVYILRGARIFFFTADSQEGILFHPENYIIGHGMGQPEKFFLKILLDSLRFVIILLNLAVLAGQGFDNPPSLSPFRLFFPYPKQPAFYLKRIFSLPVVWLWLHYRV